MKAITSALPADHAADPGRTVLDAVRKTLADLDAYPLGDWTDDVEAAALVGRLRGLVGVLVEVVDR